MKLVDFTVWGADGVVGTGEPLRVGVPLPKGVVRHASLLSLTAASKPLPLDVNATQYWPDGSVRWCLLDTLVPGNTNIGQAQQLITLQLGERKLTEHNIRVTERKDGSWHVDTGGCQFQVQGDELKVASIGEKSVVLGGAALHVDGVRVSTAQVEHSRWSSTLASARVTLTQFGVFRSVDVGIYCQFESVVSFHANSGRVNWQFTVHNPKAAIHEGGLWDLGDPASLMFSGLKMTCRLPDVGELQIQLEPESEWLSGVSQMDLVQASSGGNAWQSTNHVDCSGQVNLAFKGYQYTAGNEGQVGNRASPLLYANCGIGVYLDRFWQNFPKALYFAEHELVLDLFPELEGYEHELQPGESKTHHLRFDFTGDRDKCEQLRTPLQISFPPGYIENTACLQHFSTQHEALNSLIDMGLDPQLGFGAKREVIDEYGWRNFGDIFADHESLYLPDGKLYVSHYNNQYDPLYGFLRQYFVSGRREWLNLAEELAWHLVDIDIYNTREDRAEYNGGLFWHTDHYVDAFTSSHRTYSRQQQPDGQNVTQGGGPGAEHCYTHGLMLHYCLSGSERSRHAVLQLTDWITHFYEGTGTLIEWMLDFKVRMLPRIRYARDSGKILDHKYPFNRGVGNYINALLDSLAITNDRRYLQKAEKVILGTFNPLDEIEDRNLNDVESTWFYTIFLQAVVRYLEVKKQYGEQAGGEFIGIRDAFMKYANWMLEYEKPYLDQADILEYPNDTWVAQDLRKACLLFYASGYAPNSILRKRFESRASGLFSYVSETLTQSSTRHFSRILAILMQNHGVAGYFQQSREACDEIPPPSESEQVFESAYRTRAQIIFRAFIDFLNHLKNFSLRNELKWLSYRQRRVAGIYSRLYGNSTRKGDT